MKETIKVVLIDNHPLFRMGVGQTISDNPNFEVVGEASSGQEGLDLAQKVQPDMVLIDLNMKGMNGLEALRCFKATSPEVRLIMLTVSNTEDDLLDALLAGVDGYLLKDIDPEDLCVMLLKVFVGPPALHDSLPQVMSNPLLETDVRKNTNDLALTVREHDILESLAEGLNNGAIAIKLGISLTTVKVHVRNLLRKMNVNSRLEAAVWKHHQDAVRN